MTLQRACTFINQKVIRVRRQPGCGDGTGGRRELIALLWLAYNCKRADKCPALPVRLSISTAGDNPLSAIWDSVFRMSAIGDALSKNCQSACSPVHAVAFGVIIHGWG